MTETFPPAGQALLSLDKGSDADGPFVIVTTRYKVRKADEFQIRDWGAIPEEMKEQVRNHVPPPDSPAVRKVMGYK